MATKKNLELDGALAEKKEEFINTGIEKKHLDKKSKGPPLYLLLMLIVLGILVGVAAMMLLSNPKPIEPINQSPSPSINDLGYKTVPITILYSDDCERCRE